MTQNDNIYTVYSAGISTIDAMHKHANEVCDCAEKVNKKEKKRKDVGRSCKLLQIFITSFFPPSNYLQYWVIIIYSAVPPAPPPAVLLLTAKFTAMGCVAR